MTKPSWEHRLAEADKVGYAAITLVPYEITRTLSEDEQRRLLKKELLVTAAAQRLIRGMLKGVLKYESDDISLEEWDEHIVDEASDLLNYVWLRREAGL